MDHVGGIDLDSHAVASDFCMIGVVTISINTMDLVREVAVSHEKW